LPLSGVERLLVWRLVSLHLHVRCSLLLRVKRWSWLFDVYFFCLGFVARRLTWCYQASVMVTSDWSIDSSGVLIECLVTLVSVFIALIKFILYHVYIFLRGSAHVLLLDMQVPIFSLVVFLRVDHFGDL